MCSLQSSFTLIIPFVLRYVGLGWMVPECSRSSGLIASCCFILFPLQILVISDTQDNLIKVQQLPQVWSLTATTDAEAQHNHWNTANCINIQQEVWQIGRIASPLTVRASQLVAPYLDTPRLFTPVPYTHLTLPTRSIKCRSRWSPYH